MKGWTQHPISTNRLVEFADLYVFTFVDGTQLFLTSFDQDVHCAGPFPGTNLLANNYRNQDFLFRRGPAIERSSITWQAGVKPSEVKLRISSDQRFLTRNLFNWQQAAQRGLLDWATVKIWRAYGPFTYGPDGSATAPFVLGGPHGNVVVPLFLGYIGEFANISRYGLDMTLYDARILLNQNAPRHVFTHHCRWTLYDAGCTLNRANFGVASTILPGSTQNVILCSLPQQLSGYFDLGYMQVTSGDNVGFRADILFHIAAGASYAKIVLADGAIGYWRLNDPIGSTTAHDSTGNGYTGTITGFVGAVTPGGPALINGDGTAGSFMFTPQWVSYPASDAQKNGGSVRLPIPTPRSFPSYAGGVTMEWVMNCQFQPPSGVMAPAAIFDSAPGQLFSLRGWDRGTAAIGSGQFTMYGEWLPGFNAGDSIKTVGSPMHYIICFRAQRIIDVYVNGNLVVSSGASGGDFQGFSWGTSTSNMGSSSLSPIPFSIGEVFNLDQSAQRWLYGNLAEFAIYDYAFSPDQALLHAAAFNSAPVNLSSAQLNLLEPLPQPVKPGDTIIVYPGCDWTLRTCVKKFNNEANYGGFPQIPEQEAGW